jgi:hypothetical protein
MTDETGKSWTRHAEEVAEESFDASDYEQSSEISKGLAETHEQLSDAYASGTSDGVFVRGGSKLQDEEH